MSCKLFSMKKKNIPLIIGLCIPVLMIVIVALSILIPKAFAPKPSYSFIYATWKQYPQYRYYVREGKIILEDCNPPYKDYKDALNRPRLFVYDVTLNECKRITFEEAQSYKLNDKCKSPDGFEVIRGSYDSYDPFFYSSRDYNAIYLKGHHISKKIDIGKVADYYWHKFEFIGWIMDRNGDKNGKKPAN